MNKLTRRTILGIAGATALHPVFAQDPFGSKPIRIIVPNTAGGAPDVIARQVGQRLSEMWNQSVVVENRPGAGGMIGTDYVARQRPDGQCLLMGGIGQNAIAPVIYRNVTYDPIRDFTPITTTARFANVLMGAASFKPEKLEEVIAMAKAEPGKISYASPGNGSSPHLAGELFCQMTGIQLIHVPYAGSPEALTSLMGGQVQLMFDTLVGGSLGAIRSGKVKGYAVTSENRSPFTPDLPTMDEAAVRGYELAPWAALYGPAKLPESIVQKINADMKKVLAEPATIEKLADAGMVASWCENGELLRLNTSELERFRDLARKANISVG